MVRRMPISKLRDSGSFRRTAGQKPPRSITLIVCEGETEQEYFEAARIKYGLTTATKNGNSSKSRAAAGGDQLQDALAQRARTTRERAPASRKSDQKDITDPQEETIEVALPLEAINMQRCGGRVRAHWRRRGR
jgi:hypothetical protein